MYITPNDKRFMADTDSASIQNAIDAAAAAGGCRRVVIPRYNERNGSELWEISKTILLPSDITVILDGCHLRLADGVYENIFRNSHMYTPEALTEEGEQRNIHIIGYAGAVLDGGNDNGACEQGYRFGRTPHPRTGNLILLNNVSHYTLEGFRCINMRYWAINQIACRAGRLSHLSFFNGEQRPNQDGINLRMGCSDIIIEDITGRTGDDVVALSSFPGLYSREKGDYQFLPYHMDPDIHHITIRDVYAHTRQTVVALRCCDGAKIYSVLIENISDCGGEYGPWGVVRIGENNYYKKRSAVLGEMYDITVRNVRSLARGTVYLSASLSDSKISDIYAGGETMYAVSTYQPTQIFKENDCAITGGVSMKNVTIENVYYHGTAGHSHEKGLTDVTVPYHGCALDFRCMRDSDVLENVCFRNIVTEEGIPVSLCHEKFRLDIE